MSKIDQHQVSTHWARMFQECTITNDMQSQYMINSFLPLFHQCLQTIYYINHENELSEFDKSKNISICYEYSSFTIDQLTYHSTKVFIPNAIVYMAGNTMAADVAPGIDPITISTSPRP